MVPKSFISAGTSSLSEDNGPLLHGIVALPWDGYQVCTSNTNKAGSNLQQKQFGVR